MLVIIRDSYWLCQPEHYFTYSGLPHTMVALDLLHYHSQGSNVLQFPYMNQPQTCHNQKPATHRADLPVLCSCFPLVIYFTFGSVCMSMLLFHFIPAYPSFSPCPPQVHSLRLRLYSCPAPRFIRATSLF